MNRNSTNERKPFGVNGPQARELTEAELDLVSGGTDQTAATYTAALVCRKSSGSMAGTI